MKRRVIIRQFYVAAPQDESPPFELQHNEKIITTQYVVNQYPHWHGSQSAGWWLVTTERPA